MKPVHFHRTGRRMRIVLFLVLLLTVLNPSIYALGNPEEALSWWLWPLLLFVLCIFLGIIAVVAGVGGAVLYVPIVSAISPFHLDFVRGSGLVVALAGAIGASPRLLKSNMASLRLALPLAFFSSIGAFIGANVGMTLPSRVVELILGMVLIAVITLMLFTKSIDYPPLCEKGLLARHMNIGGTYTDEFTMNSVEWGIRRMPLGFIVFFIIGLMGGIFGLGSGWANVPTLNLLLGAPLKIAVGTSALIITMTSSSASWVFMRQGAILPIIVVPSMAGMMLGTRIGAKFLPRIPGTIVRYFVLGILIFTTLILLFKIV